MLNIKYTEHKVLGERLIIIFSHKALFFNYVLNVVMALFFKCLEKASNKGYY